MTYLRLFTSVAHPIRLFAPSRPKIATNPLIAVIAWSSVSASAELSMPATGTPTMPAAAVTMVISEA